LRLKAIAMLLGLLLLPVAALVTLWPAHGLEAEYAVVTPAGPVACRQTVDPNLFFAQEGIFLAPARLHWQTSRHGDNAEKPVLHVRWRGYLRAPETGEYRFGNAAPGLLKITIDGREILAPQNDAPPVPLTAGLHEFAAEYRGVQGPRLKWKQGGAAARIIEGKFFYRRQPWPGARLVALLALFLLPVLEIVLLARRRPALSETLLTYVTRRKVWLVLALLAVLVLATRLVRYDRLPYPSETADEYYVELNALNLVFTGIPKSWSQLPAYQANQQEHRRMFGDAFMIVRPSFDHPPGLPYLVGWYLRLTGARLEEATEHLFLHRTRLLGVAAAVLQMLLLFFLAARVLRRRDLALLAATFFALNPTAAYAGRLLKEENFLVLLLLGSLLLLARYLENGRLRWLLAAALIAGLSCLVKVSGLAVVGGVAAVLLAERRWRAVGPVLLCGLAGLGGYFLYGYLIDWETFWRVLQDQQTRDFGRHKQPVLSTRGLLSLLTDTGVAHRHFGSLTHLWFWLALLFFWIDRTRHREPGDYRVSLLVWPPLIYLVFMAIAASSDRSFGWYRIPLTPFFAVAAAWYVRRMVRDADLPLTALFCLMPLVDALYWGWLAPAPEHPFGFRLLLLAPLGFLIVAHLLSEERKAAAVRLTALAAVIATLLFSLAAIFNYWNLYNLPY